MYIYIMGIKISNIESNIKNRGIKITWLVNQLGISRGTYYKRIKDKEFTIEEFNKLKELGLV